MITRSQAWPTATRRRGALAAILFLAIGTDAYMDPAVGGWTILTGYVGPWWDPVSNLIHIALMSGALLLLGPRSWPGVVGRRITPGWAAIAVATGLLGALGSLGYGLLAHAVAPPQMRAPGQVFYWLPAWLSMTLLGPLMEEYVFRGLLWEAARRVAPPALTILFTALTFALGHGPEMVGSFPFLAAYGLALGVLRQRSGGIGAPFLAHSVTNVGVLGFVWLQFV